jgi:hypothetical protein
MSAPNDKRQLPYGGAFAIQDPEIINFMKSLTLVDSLWQEDITQQFCKEYKDWIKSSKNNLVRGLDDYKYAVYSNGTSQAFDMFYIKNKDRRFRCFKGEYIYHQLAWRNNWPDWKFIEDEKLSDNDAVVISLPFADTGDKHEEMEFLLHNCNAMGIPVLVDCAYFGICNDIDFNFRHECITDIVFSLSKTFPVAHARIGMRLTKQDDDDLMFVYDKINYNNRIGATIGLELIKQFGPDYIYEKYKTQQLKMCIENLVVPSKCVIFGIDYDGQYSEYNRGSHTNRLGFHKHYDIKTN